MIFDVLSRLENVKKKGNGGYTARCPSHEDKKNSLSVAYKDGRILFKCFAGCKTEEVVNAIGLELKDLFDDSPLSTSKTLSLFDLAKAKHIPQEFLSELGVVQKGSAVHIYYRTKSGKLHSRYRIRTDVSAKHGSFWNKSQGKIIPYGLWLPYDKDRTVTIVEGESDCWTLLYHGIPVLGIPGTSCVHVLQNQHVSNISTIYVFSEPDKAGTEFPRRVANRLAEIGWQGNLKKISLPGYKDPNDFHIAVHGDSKKFRAAWNLAIESAVPIPIDYSDDHNVPSIEVSGGRLHLMADEAEKILIQSGGIYQRDGFLVYIGYDKRKEIEFPVIRNVEPHWLLDRLSKIIQWKKVDTKTKKTKNVDPPKDVIGIILSRRDTWNFPVLMGIVFAPTLRADGSILQEPGYDPQTGIFLYFGKWSFPRINENPSRNDALKAMESIKEIFEEFPFDGETDRSVAIAALLTSLVRRSLPTAPLFGFSAPRMRSGKSLLAKVISLVSMGFQGTVISYDEGKFSDEENRKRYLSILLNAEPIVIIDNIEAPLRGSTLSIILTEGRWSERILGRNETVSVQNSTLWLATGNNLSITGDLSVRSLICYIDPKMEKPEERSFRYNLEEFVLANRSKIVVSALTILRAYYVSGCPTVNISPWGGFDQWNNLIRASLIWLDEADPVSSRIRIEEGDEERELLSSFLAACWETVGEREFTLSEIIQEAKGEFLFDKKTFANGYPELMEKLVMISGGKEVNPRKIGKFLNKFVNRCEGGFQLKKAGKGSSGVLWKVCRKDT